MNVKILLIEKFVSTIQHEYDAIEMMRITKTDSDENANVCTVYVVLYCIGKC